MEITKDFFETDPTDYSIEEINVVKISSAGKKIFLDKLAAEEPLEIRLNFYQNGENFAKNLAVTMRTPGFDRELSIGFLFTEGIITGQVDDILSYHKGCEAGRRNTITLVVPPDKHINLQNSERNFYTTSSCGVCGKSSIEAIRTITKVNSFNDHQTPLLVQRKVFYTLSNKLQMHQRLFSATGGLHACGLFSIHGDLLGYMEDVGRHNALDKLIGWSLNEKMIPLENHILLLSGRASFELIQKAAVAGIQIVAAIGAPSSLAVSLAREFGMTLIGFLKNDHFNIYSAQERII